jgi:hypothetical protein
MAMSGSAAERAGGDNSGERPCRSEGWGPVDGRRVLVAPRTVDRVDSAFTWSVTVISIPLCSLTAPLDGHEWAREPPPGPALSLCSFLRGVRAKRNSALLGNRTQLEHISTALSIRGLQIAY